MSLSIWVPNYRFRPTTSFRDDPIVLGYVAPPGASPPGEATVPGGYAPALSPRASFNKLNRAVELKLQPMLTLNLVSSLYIRRGRRLPSMVTSLLRQISWLEVPQKTPIILASPLPFPLASRTLAQLNDLVLPLDWYFTDASHLETPSDASLLEAATPFPLKREAVAAAFAKIAPHLLESCYRGQVIRELRA